MTPTSILAKALERFDRNAREDLARRAGIPIGIVGKAAGKRPISADHLLRLCAVIGIDPLTGYALNPQESAGEFDRNSLAIAIRLYFEMRKHKVREAAKSVDISATVFLRVMTGELAAIESVLAGCRYVGLHPFSYLRVPADVSQKQSPEQAA